MKYKIFVLFLILFLLSNQNNNNKVEYNIYQNFKFKNLNKLNIEHKFLNQKIDDNKENYKLDEPINQPLKYNESYFAKSDKTFYTKSKDPKLNEFPISKNFIFERVNKLIYNYEKYIGRLFGFKKNYYELLRGTFFIPEIEEDEYSSYNYIYYDFRGKPDELIPTISSRHTLYLTLSSILASFEFAGLVGVTDVNCRIAFSIAFIVSAMLCIIYFTILNFEISLEGDSDLMIVISLKEYTTLFVWVDFIFKIQIYLFNFAFIVFIWNYMGANKEDYFNRQSIYFKYILLVFIILLVAFQEFTYLWFANSQSEHKRSVLTGRDILSNLEYARLLKKNHLDIFGMKLLEAPYKQDTKDDETDDEAKTDDKSQVKDEAEKENKAQDKQEAEKENKAQDKQEAEKENKAQDKDEAEKENKAQDKQEAEKENKAQDKQEAETEGSRNR